MNTQFYAPDRQATSPQDASRTERRTATIRPVMPESPRTRIGVGVDARKLWAGGAASAVVAGLVALVGVLISRWLFAVPVLAPEPGGRLRRRAHDRPDRGRHGGDAGRDRAGPAADARHVAAADVLRLDRGPGDHDHRCLPVQHHRPARRQDRHGSGQPGHRRRGRHARRRVAARSSAPYDEISRH